MAETVSVADGKYTVINDNGHLTALRNGEPWDRDLTGDNLVYWLTVELAQARERLAGLQQVTDAAKAPRAEPLTDAARVLALLDSGDWSLTRHTPSPALTAAANARHAWSVRREAAPYCDESDNRQWSGPTAISAFDTAMKSLGIAKQAAPDQAQHAAMGCRTCHKPLLANEVEMYGDTCEACERAADVAMADELRDIPQAKTHKAAQEPKFVDCGQCPRVSTGCREKCMRPSIADRVNG